MFKGLGVYSETPPRCKAIKGLQLGMKRLTMIINTIKNEQDFKAERERESAAVVNQKKSDKEDSYREKGRDSF